MVDEEDARNSKSSHLGKTENFQTFSSKNFRHFWGLFFFFCFSRRKLVNTQNPLPPMCAPISQCCRKTLHCSPFSQVVLRPGCCCCCFRRRRVSNSRKIPATLEATSSSARARKNPDFELQAQFSLLRSKICRLSQNCLEICLSKLENITIAKIITKTKMMHEQTKNQLV